MDKNIIAVIPARGGSKGVPKKNIRLVCNKPLISYSINAALSSSYVTRIVVSTDDPDIASISEKCGAEVLMRPVELSGDTVSASDVVIHVGETLLKKGQIPDILIMLQPTSPLRTSGDIDNALQLFMENECDSVISVIKEEHPPLWCLKIVDKYLEPMFGWENLKKTRQEFPESYKPNGAIFIASLKTLKEQDGFYCGKLLPYIMPPERSVDIDSEMDLTLAQFLLEVRNNAL